jgi:iron complex transport system substrate-binding protein
MRKTWAFLVFLLAGGAGAAETPSPMYLGTPRPQEIPRRVVSLAPNLTEILFSLGVGDRIVGVTRYDDFPPQVENLPKIGGFVDPSLEAILTLRPDLVVCVPNPGGKHPLETIARLGTPVLVLPSYSLEDIFRSVETLGALFDKKERADEINRSLQAQIQRVTKHCASRSKPKTLFVVGHKPLIVAGTGSFADRILSIAGGENIVARSLVPYPTLPMEELIRLGPEVIIDASMSGKGAEMSKSELEFFWKKWEIVPAIKNHRLYLFDSSVWFRAGPRIADGIQRLTEILHPIDSDSK